MKCGCCEMNMKIAVLKFGGTSVANAEARQYAAERIRKFLQDGYRVVTVVSAMGRKGMPYATDTLLSLISENAEPECKDLLMSCGETISASIFADVLCNAGIDAVPMSAVTAGIYTDGTAQNANITKVDTDAIRSVLEQKKVTVITGFQGISLSRRINTLGRGGSDTSAVVLAAWMRAEICVIYTDVPGIASCDPRIVPGASYFRCINTDQMYLLAQNGAGVIHERAVKAAMENGVRLYVRSTFDTDTGTLIANDIPPKNGFVGIALRHDGEMDVVSILAPQIKALPPRATEAADAVGASVCACPEDGIFQICVDKNKSAEMVRNLYHCVTAHPFLSPLGGRSVQRSQNHS